MAIKKENAILAKTSNNGCGTSYHSYCIITTKKKLRQILGEPNYDDSSNVEYDKVTIEWVRELKLGGENPFVFTVYDWKEYRKYSETAKIEFHIGTMSTNDSALVFNILNTLLEGETESQFFKIKNKCI